MFNYCRWWLLGSACLNTTVIEYTKTSALAVVLSARWLQLYITRVTSYCKCNADDVATFPGRDEKGWSMYIDDSRSWFMHRGKPIDRTEGGIHLRSTVGVLLDLDQGRLQYFIDKRPHGPSSAFTDHLRGVFYPAVSLNRNIQLTLHSGLQPPGTSTSNIQGAKSFT